MLQLTVSAWLGSQSWKVITKIFEAKVAQLHEDSTEFCKRIPGKGKKGNMTQGTVSIRSTRPEGS